MIQVSVQQVRMHLSKYLNAIEDGEVVVVCRHSKPVAELRRIPPPLESSGTPRFGLWQGFGVAESFFEPLPDDVLKAFGEE